MFSQLKWDDYQEQIDGALKASYYVCQEGIPLMKKQTRGSIVNIVTNLVERPIVPYHDYTTAKSALIGFSRNLAVELGAFGIRVNCIAPGIVYPTDASRETKEEVKEMIIAQTPLRRIATPSDIVGPVLFLASEWSSFMTGQTLFVDGGLVMS
jgi:3-oxoacyl-[acyl-carrier protein] reductase